MNVALRCNRCQREMQSTGMRGLCPSCLFACTTARWSNSDEVAPHDTENLVSEATVGPDDRFLLLDKLGEGGMGEVWLANDQALSQPGEPQFVALKFLSKAIRHNKSALAALRSEVLRSQKLAHPNIVRIYDLHTTRNGTAFIKMEFVEGNNLNHWLRERPEPVMPWRMTVQVVHQLAGALQYAHQVVGIVHRDIKPANLLLAHGGVIKLSDFGIARPIREQSKTSPEAELVGTLSYASPQQIAGANPDPADDIYALGVTLYELLTGTPPFQAETAEELISKINTQTPQTIPNRLLLLNRENDVPAKLLILVRRCLEKNPLDRPKANELPRLLPPMDETNRLITQSEVEWQTEEGPSRRLAEWFWTALFILVVLAGVAWLFDIADTRTKVKRWAGVQTDETPKRSDVPNFEFKLPPATAETSTNANIPSSSNLSTPAPIIPNNRPQATAEQGQLKLVIASQSQFAGYHCEVFNSNGQVVLRQTFNRTRSPSLVTNLTAGDYTARVSVTSGLTWVIQKSFQITRGQDSNVRIPFQQGTLKVRSIPPGISVEWRTDSGDSGTGTTPFDQEDFKSGRVYFQTSQPGYRRLGTNFFFEPVVSPACQLNLERNVNPTWGEDWTNSLGLEFKWVLAIKGWAATTETRIRDYRLYFKNAPPDDARENAFSLTADGWVKQGGSWENPGFAQSEEHPVVMVNWYDAMQFCEWLNLAEPADHCLATNQHYSLPTTNDWSTIAGDNLYPWGPDPEPPRSYNYAGREVIGSGWPAIWPTLTDHEDAYARTAPVNLVVSPKSGFHHLGGNAAEWCLEKVLRGGSWFDGEDLHRGCLQTTAVRPENPNRRDSRNGFRLIIKQSP